MNAPQPVDVPTVTAVTLHVVEYVRNNLGVWDRAWFLSKAEAEAFHAAKVGEGFDPSLEGGEYGALGTPQEVPVVLTPVGLLAFAQNWAVDQV